jgi:hypothetical protein
LRGRYAGEGRGEGEKSADRPGPAVSGRERRESGRSSGWGKKMGLLGPRGGKGKREKRVALGLGRERREGREPREEKRVGRAERDGLGWLLLLFFLFSFSFFYTPLIQTILLEFKYKLNSNL